MTTKLLAQNNVLSYSRSEGSLAKPRCLQGCVPPPTQGLSEYAQGNKFQILGVGTWTSLGAMILPTTVWVSERPWRAPWPQEAGRTGLTPPKRLIFHPALPPAGQMGGESRAGCEGNKARGAGGTRSFVFASPTPKAPTRPLILSTSTALLFHPPAIYSVSEGVVLLKRIS